MKKLLLIITMCALLTGCGKAIDKKIVITEYGQNIEKIKGAHPEYTSEDFSKASEVLDRYAFAAMADGNMKLEKTYRELLDEAKAQNEKEAAEAAAYYKAIDDMRAIVAAKVIAAELFDEFSPVLGENYRSFIAETEFTNNSDKLVTGLEGKILVKNAEGDILKTCYIKVADKNLLPAGKAQKGTGEYPILEDYDNLTELKAIPTDKLEYEWVPGLILFADGSRTEAPQMPHFLMPDEF